jgi:MFS family permease
VLIILPGLLLAIMLAMLDQLVVSTALPRIVGDLGGVTHLSWVVTAYVLASTVTTPLYGKLGDQYGRKRWLMIAIVIFLAGSALSGLAHSMDQLIAFRALQGLGAGGLLTGIFANSAMASAFGVSASGLISGGGADLLKWQFLTAAWVIVFAAIGTFILLNIVKLFVPLRMTEQEMEEGDLAVHGHEVYPSDVPSLAFPSGFPATPPERPAEAPGRCPNHGAESKGSSPRS